MLITVSIETADRGNVVRTQVGLQPAKVEIVEGRQGSQNLADRTRRLVAEIVASVFPSDRTTAAKPPR